MSVNNQERFSFTIMALESGIKYPSLAEAPDEPLLIEMVGIQPEYFGTLSTKFEVDLEDLQDLLDMDERPRLQLEDKFAMLVLRVPIDLYIPGSDRNYSTSPIGIFTNGRDIIILQHDVIPLRKKRLRYVIRRSTSASEIIYNQLEIVIHSFETTLDIIEATINEAEEGFRRELYPSRLDRFFQLSRDAIFMDAALKGNMRVLRRLKTMKRFGKMILDEDRLEELEVDLQQQMELSIIYRALIQNAVDGYDSLVGHNLNAVIKTLTSISVLVSVPTLIASLYGMNLSLPLEENPFGFMIILGISMMTTLPILFYLRVRNLL